MDMFLEKQIQILEKYSDDQQLDQISIFSNKQKEEILQALQGSMLVAKRDKIQRDKKSIKYLCQTKLETLLLLEKQEQEKPLEENNKRYQEKYIHHKEDYLIQLESGERKREIVETNHVFDHVLSDTSKYKVGSLMEKIKYARGFEPFFFVRKWQQANYINREYMHLDPEKIDVSMISFFKTGIVEKRKYTPEEQMVLKEWLLDNQEYCKEILFSYQPLFIPTEGGYKEQSTERIVKLKHGGYLVSENMPIRYHEKHLRKYRGNDVAFEIFTEKQQLLNYLKNQLEFMQEQQKRFQETIAYFTSLDPDALDQEKIKYAYTGFSTHGTYTDQYITEKLDQLLTGDKRGRQQIVKSIIDQANMGIKESSEKEKIMRTHYDTILQNPLF